MALSWESPKDPEEVLDYVIDWAARIAEDDQIISSSWEVPTGITKDSDSFTGTTTTIWLSGGTLASTYEFVNRIVTEDGRTMDQTMKLKIKTK